MDFFSGGEEIRKKIVVVFLFGVELFVVDELMSYLDVKGVEKFEEEMKFFIGSFLLILYDWELLNCFCMFIWEVENGKIYCYEGNY